MPLVWRVVVGALTGVCCVSALVSAHGGIKKTSVRHSQPGSLDCDVTAIADSEEAWMRLMESLSALPKGFRAGATSLDFVPVEVPGGSAKTMNLAALVLDEPTTSIGAVFTRNALSGCPVTIGRRRMAAQKPVSGIVINNKISNVRPRGDGEDAAEKVCAAVAEACGFENKEALLPASTGIIGWALPVPEMQSAAPALAASLQPDSILPVATAMMTTDRYAKVARAELKGGTVLGVAKGAGMIEPALCATMLSFITTDVKIGREDLQKCLERVSKRSYGSIGVDGDESTSDMVVVISSNQNDSTSVEEFERALGDVCAQLAHQIVRNGEGTNHVIRMVVKGDHTEDSCRDLARAIVNGPLLKSAVAGNDPNVGRLVGKLGQCLGARGEALPDSTVVSIGGETIYADGTFTIDAEKEKRLTAHLLSAQLAEPDIGLPGAGRGEPFAPHGRCVEIEIDLGGDPETQAVVLGSDLTHQYVTENADYRS